MVNTEVGVGMFQEIPSLEKVLQEESTKFLLDYEDRVDGGLQTLSVQVETPSEISS